MWCPQTVLSILNDIAKSLVVWVFCIPQPFIYSRGERISLKLTTRLGMIADGVESITTADLIILNHLETPTYTVSFKVSIIEWQCKNESSNHRTAKHFCINCKHVREWCQKYSLLKDQTCGALRKRCHICCGKPCTKWEPHQMAGWQQKSTNTG